jgi:5-methylthioribose kinase
VPQSWECFCSRLTAHWPRRQSPGKYPDSFLDWWLSRIRSDALGFAGCEAARRTIGLAKVSDLESLDDAGYASAAGTMLRLSRLLLVERDSLDFERLTRVATG